MIRVLFFGRLAELAGGREREAPASLTSIGAVRHWLAESDDVLRGALAAPSIKVAVNSALVHGDAALRDGDEVAFMPPLSGG